VIGPLALVDLICWQAAIGPAYRGGALGLRDCIDAPHTAVRHPVIDWPVKYSQQHEDVHMTAQRGMPAPFDNGVMRLCQISRLFTDWMGDSGFLRRLCLRMEAPLILGDVTWCDATITQARHDERAVQLALSIAGRNQHGETTTRGSAEVTVPLDQLRAAPS
jgi:hypothetical protein